MENWENLCGENNWEGLLEPLDDNLRRLIIHYGEMVEATYNAYDSNDNSTTGCKYDKENLFSKVGLGIGSFTKKEYIITKYIYATASFTPFDKDTNWMGYIAVATDERTKKLGWRDIVVAWRGTKELSEWSKNMLALKKPASKIFGDHTIRSNISSMVDGHPHLTSILNKVSPSPLISSFPNIGVHMGFYQIYTTKNKNSTFCKTSARYQVLEEVSNQLNKYYKKETAVRVIVTGHSLGGALAILSAVDIAKNVPSKPKVTAFPFGCPQVGGSELRDFVDKYKTKLHILCIENKPDVVPDLLRTDVLNGVIDEINDVIDDVQWITNLLDIKPDLLNHISYYNDVGKRLLVDTDKSNYLKELGIFKAKTMAHNMEVYLHGVSGTEGRTNDSFKKNVERNIALVNKHGDYLKDSYGFPASWWDEPDKANMVQNQNGKWKLTKRKRNWIKNKLHIWDDQPI